MPHLICYDIEENYLRTKLGDSIMDAGFPALRIFCGPPAINKPRRWRHMIA